MEKSEIKSGVAKEKLVRCANWLDQQNTQEPKRFMLENKHNDIQFIIETNADRKKFLMSSVDDASVPAGVDEVNKKPVKVPRRKLRTDCLRLECEWKICRWASYNYEDFQKHVRDHLSNVHVIDDQKGSVYVCLWDICGHKTSDYIEMTRHIDYHSYHSKLLAIGFNGRATLNLDVCKKDSTKRNQLPPLKTDFQCMWIGCGNKFTFAQAFYDHVRVHVYCSLGNIVCSWGGCGSTFPHRRFLHVHVRSHTGERLIACYHCGIHFATNRKLCDHLRRQNTPKDGGYICTVCSSVWASEYLMRDHARQHISVHACTYCDMTAPTLASLTSHIRYRHLGDQLELRMHCCPHCSYRAITKWDLRKHIPTHKLNKDASTEVLSDEENASEDIKSRKKKVLKKYCCHMCPEKNMKIFSIGTSLTSHLVKVHGIHWPFGHSRFRYQISDDGMYRLTTTRYESLEVSKKIMKGCSVPMRPTVDDFEVELQQKAEATLSTPKQYAVKLKGEPNQNAIDLFNEFKLKPKEPPTVEITMCDVDEQGNVVCSEVVKSDVFFTK